MSMLEDIVESISVNNLRDITIWANGNHKNINCIIDDLLGASCFCCPYYISDNLPKCAFGKVYCFMTDEFSNMAK